MSETPNQGSENAPDNVLEGRDLIKRFGTTTAVQDVSSTSDAVRSSSSWGSLARARRRWCVVSVDWSSRRLARFGSTGGHPSRADRTAQRTNPAYDLIENFQWTNEDQQLVAGYIARDTMTPEAAAKKWLEDNPETWKQWLP